jgi:hypothetical protein
LIDIVFLFISFLQPSIIFFAAATGAEGRGRQRQRERERQQRGETGQRRGTHSLSFSSDYVLHA